ncbi:acyltransferase [Terrabacter lapilli]|uniref:acyltransferase family protein n=1 Tax=Terrabacter lapilli TaxID=436231 RepID=UPI0031D1A712
MTDSSLSGTLVIVTGDMGWSQLDSRDNALNTIRLALAATVVLAHSWQFVHGYNWPPLSYASGVAVDGFFVLSGFLIAGSRMKVTLATFLLRRALRILPGFWAVLLVTAFCVAPLVAAVQGAGFDWWSAAGYVTRNAALAIHQPDISGLAASAPVPIWNSSLWTLIWEGAAYLMAGVLLWREEWRRSGSWMLLGGLTFVLITWFSAELGGGQGRPLTLLAFFAGGMALRFESHRLPLRKDIAAASAATLACTFTLGSAVAYAIVGPVSVGYLLLWIAVRVPLRLGARNDISYGIYIYAAPLQMAAVTLGWAKALGPIAFAGISLASVVPAAWASWVFVERPAMRLAGRKAGTRRFCLNPDLNVGGKQEVPAEQRKVPPPPAVHSSQALPWLY